MRIKKKSKIHSIANGKLGTKINAQCLAVCVSWCSQHSLVAMPVLPCHLQEARRRFPIRERKPYQMSLQKLSSSNRDSYIIHLNIAL